MKIDSAKHEWMPLSRDMTRAWGGLSLAGLGISRDKIRKCRDAD